MSDPIGTEHLIDAKILSRTVKEVVVIDENIEPWHCLVGDLGDWGQGYVYADLILELLAVLR